MTKDQLVHLIDAIASLVLGIVVMVSFAGGSKLYASWNDNAATALFLYTLVGVLAVGWWFYRKFGRAL